MNRQVQIPSLLIKRWVGERTTNSPLKVRKVMWQAHVNVLSSLQGDEVSKPKIYPATTVQWNLPTVELIKMHFYISSI